jgi:hypothetical protein
MFWTVNNQQVDRCLFGHCESTGSRTLGMYFISYLDCICISKFLSLYYDYCNRSNQSVNFLATYEQYKKLFDSPLAYYSITGIQQIVTSVLVILIILGKIEITKKYLWVRGLAILLIFNFAFNFVIAVGSSMSATYYN